jgi:DNA polymerase I-like protein with 3'-5' exonuclease and polymerase domains
MTIGEARSLISSFFKQFPGVGTWMTRAKDLVRKCGYATSLLNYRRYLPDINATDSSVRAKAERSAINSIIQGSAAEVLKMAMLRVEAAVHREAHLWGGPEPAAAVAVAAAAGPPAYMHAPAAAAANSRQPRPPNLIMSIHDEVIYEVYASHVPQFVALLRRVMEVSSDAEYCTFMQTAVSSIIYLPLCSSNRPLNYHLHFPPILTISLYSVCIVLLDASRCRRKCRVAATSKCRSS